MVQEPEKSIEVSRESMFCSMVFWRCLQIFQIPQGENIRIAAVPKGAKGGTTDIKKDVRNNLHFLEVIMLPFPQGKKTWHIFSEAWEAEVSSCFFCF